MGQWNAGACIVLRVFRLFLFLVHPISTCRKLSVYRILVLTRGLTSTRKTTPRVNLLHLITNLASAALGAGVHSLRSEPSRPTWTHHLDSPLCCLHEFTYTLPGDISWRSSQPPHFHPLRNATLHCPFCRKVKTDNGKKSSPHSLPTEMRGNRSREPRLIQAPFLFYFLSGPTTP